MTAYKKLLSLVNNESTGHLQFKDYSLDSIRKLLRIYGDPHKKIKTIHIAGTNGKGSVAHYLNRILIESGYNTGLYTSPHLNRLNERICINSNEIDDKFINKYTEELFELLQENIELRPTFFDALTLFAIRHFYDEKVDIAVIETGLGGRLDSTNVINPIISIITDISLEHKDVLGNTLYKIAVEKAGIIKKNSITITSNNSRSPFKVITETCKKNKSKLYVFRKDIIIKNIKSVTDTKSKTFDFDLVLGKNRIFKIQNITLNSPGNFQLKNSSISIAAAVLLREKGFIISDEDIKNGILNTIIPGRFQTIIKEPLLIYDPAHNPAAIKAILEILKYDYPEYHIVAVISFMKDKEYKKMYLQLGKTAKHLIYFQLDDPRGVTGEDMKKISRGKLVYFNNTDTLSSHISKIINGKTLVLFTGSFRIYDVAFIVNKNLKNNI